jgi:pimeloyl-ACP methyl ester carboxylesterase
MERKQVKISTQGYTTDSIISADGTKIGYRQLGQGPGLILVHGGVKSSQDFMKLATALSGNFTLYVPDRRGRGLSGPQSDPYSVDREVEDMQAIVAKTGAQFIFGLSAGALVILRTALRISSLKRIALYEPPLSIDGSVDLSWVSRYEKELAEGRLASAIVIAMKGMRVMRLFNVLPRWVLTPFLSLMMRLQGGGEGDEVVIRALVPTLHYDLRIVQEMSGTLEDYRTLSIPVLLMGGNQSPGFLKVTLDGLSNILPCAERSTFHGLGHDGPEDDGQPELVAEQLSRFFR